jgi:elongation factor Ts
MAEITAASVKELRDRSGAGMMDCKKALTEAGGDIEAATDWLRAKGLAAAQKKSSRTAAEGLVGVAVAGTSGVAVEVNSETDFVAKNDQFQDFVRSVARIALDKNAVDVEALAAESYPSGGSVSEKLVANIATIGENQTLRRLAHVSVTKGVVVPYVHNAAAPGLGKIGVLVALEGDASADVLEPLGKQIAMHIAAAFPLALSAADIDPALLERERAIAAEKASESGKPAEIVTKMVEGSVAKYAKENALLSQLFVMDNKTPIADVVAKAAKDAGAAITLKGYVRFQLGEGIEKEVSDFAAEVAAAAGVS